MIYLDNAATTRVFDCAANAAVGAMTAEYFNPNATYKSGVLVREKLERDRKTIASIIGARPDELFFTSCATESNNWVFASGIKNKKGNIVITAGEHSSVYEPAMQLKSRGCDVRIAPLTKGGAVDADALCRLADDSTALVSVIHVSNETGVINDIKRIAAAIKAKNPRTLIHSDGVQGLIKVGMPLRDSGVDFYSASAHKLGAPKGIGLLYIRNGINVSPLILGGGQERGLRSGTQNTPYIAAFAAAVDELSRQNDRNKISAIRADLCEFFAAHGCKAIGDGENSGYILCVCVPGAKAEILQNILHDKGIIVGKGAACSGAKRGNRVLEAMGIAAKDVECCVRISFFADTSADDALAAAQAIITAAKQIGSKYVK
ncbi:MAG: cysteine desulfurase family protein [Clostridia bacterium]|nr:cysteine desulfurase family protein [Clostridia bacterium]